MSSDIRTGNKTHDTTCAASEMNRQNDVAQAILTGGGNAAVAAAVRTAEIAHYRRIIASCLSQGLPSSNFTQALRDLGTGGS
ncbi:hypothetical protein ACKWRH_24965 [Bradyrhizobium sp. Pa8]|uniref:hypothetical protein n=1 Tax=Bradyrhizobium sp. Pa8 TaxID=3386552 RepID=UPI00403F8A15